MKTRVSSFLVLTAVLTASAFTFVSGAPQPQQALAHPVKFVEHFGNTVVAVGTRVSSVLRFLGTPHHKLDANVWAYTNFNGGTEQGRDDDCSTLLITFNEGSVVDLKLVNVRAEKIFAAQLLARSSDKIQVAAK